MLIYGSKPWELHLPFLNEEDSETCIGNKKIGQMSIIFKVNAWTRQKASTFFQAPCHTTALQGEVVFQLWFYY